MIGMKLKTERSKEIKYVLLLGYLQLQTVYLFKEKFKFTLMCRAELIRSCCGADHGVPPLSFCFP
eukprot:18531-Hanusia_phi.AAC.1